MINAITLAGNLTRDIELRSTSSGYTIGYLAIAVNDRVKNKQTGEYEEMPYFFDAKLLGTRAERLANYLTKGTRVTVQGKLTQERWEDKDGNRRSRNYVVVEELDFTARNGAGQQPGEPEAAAAATAPTFGEMPVATSQPEAAGPAASAEPTRQEGDVMAGDMPVVAEQAPIPAYMQYEVPSEPIEVISELIEDSAAYIDADVTDIDYREITGWQ